MGYLGLSAYYVKKNYECKINNKIIKIIKHKTIKEKKKMSLSPKKESESNDDNSNICNSDEPKVSQEQRSLVDPSTEIGSKSY